MTNERLNEMHEKISSNEKASKRLDELLEAKLGGWLDGWTVAEIIESVFNKFCK